MACTLLNQIFYKHNKFDNPDTIYSCEPYMLNKNYIQRFITEHATIIRTTPEFGVSVSGAEVERPVQGGEQVKNVVNAEEVSPRNSSVMQSIRRGLFSPRKEDTLFWSAYVVHYGESEYTLIGGKYKNAELQEKQDILAYIQKNHSLIKSCAHSNDVKLSNVRIQETTAEMMINKKTSWYAFHVMCMYYKINAVVIQDEIYMLFTVDPEYKTHVFERNQDSHFSVDLIPTDTERISNIIANKLKVDPFLPKLLKGVSTYKIPELEEMGLKLGVKPVESKPKKNDWYDVIINKLVKMLIQN